MARVRAAQRPVGQSLEAARIVWGASGTGRRTGQAEPRFSWIEFDWSAGTLCESLASNMRVEFILHIPRRISQIQGEFMVEALAKPIE